MIITLSGLPGVGKTSVGKELSSYLHCPFLDLDQEIERRTGSTISDIFRKEGESGFRRTELRILKEVIGENEKGPTVILSLGGGTPSIAQARTLLREKCTNLYLQSDCTKIADDILRYGTATRPMFFGKNRSEILELLLELKHRRESWYLEIADRIIDISQYRYQRKEQMDNR